MVLKTARQWSRERRHRHADASLHPCDATKRNLRLMISLGWRSHEECNPRASPLIRVATTVGAGQRPMGGIAFAVAGFTTAAGAKSGGRAHAGLRGDPWRM
jgi:hypothetical protein